MELEAEFQELHKTGDRKKGKWTSKSDSDKGKKGYFNKKPKTGSTYMPADKGKAPATQGKEKCGHCGCRTTLRTSAGRIWADISSVGVNSTPSRTAPRTIEKVGMREDRTSSRE